MGYSYKFIDYGAQLISIYIFWYYIMLTHFGKIGHNRQ